MSTATEVPAAQDEEDSGCGNESADAHIDERSDLQVYLEDSTRPAGDGSGPLNSISNDVILLPTDGSFQSTGLSRANSVYSFSRNSFSSQLAQLMSIRLPEPSLLEGTIEVLNVLGGLDAEEDVEWAAAGGRQSLDDITRAATKFQSLVEIYVKAVERVPFRKDIAEAGPEELTTLVFQMDNVLKNWEQVKYQLRRVKTQVELAMEWEKLWNAVLGDVSGEIDEISKLIFEMEERRHKTMAMDYESDTAHGVDINELETIVEDSPISRHMTSNPRLSMAPGLSALQLMPPIEASARNAQDDTNLLALFARMQPLRASLDFLPMHLHAFLSRARTMFPSACEEIEERRMQLERKYEKLQADATTLKEELGEDRWIIVFRNAGRQANKMCDSVERTIGKLQEAIGVGGMGVNPSKEC
ncbi:Karyogamy protein, KAR9 [Ascosphaera apis ARSEF 7405]|uniref:Karyogamy protein, KAR9 n=1 Tax=Ascosphaera apis ARSEF 7405 TaxID=392613 RepID=A0A167W5C2_9EURO|nr:Karyogamy protein, KAR9 [Ascosphaera apis ARSEF 7405]